MRDVGLAAITAFVVALPYTQAFMTVFGTTGFSCRTAGLKGLHCAASSSTRGYERSRTPRQKCHLAMRSRLKNQGSSDDEERRTRHTWAWDRALRGIRRATTRARHATSLMQAVQDTSGSHDRIPASRVSQPRTILGRLRRLFRICVEGSSINLRERMAAWQRSAGIAWVGIAAAFIVCAGSADPAFAAKASKKRLTDMPESQYQIREQVIDTIQTPRSSRTFDFKDMSLYADELNKIDMFSDDVAVPYATREAMRIKYARILDDVATGGKQRGIFAIAKTFAGGTGIALAFGTVAYSIIWLFRTFIRIANEEEVEIYGEEVSVDATEKDPEELEGLSPEDEDPAAPPDPEVDSDEDTSAGWTMNAGRDEVSADASSLAMTGPADHPSSPPIGNVDESSSEGNNDDEDLLNF